MKAILISIRPKWVEKIASGEKTIEVRKTAPKEVPFKAYIYMTHGDASIKLGNGMTCHHSGGMCVIGEFVCDKVDEIIPDYNPITEKFYYGYVVDITPTFLNEEEIQNYGKNKAVYFWHISDLKIYAKPKELSEFNRPCNYAGLCFSCDRAKFTSKGDRVCKAMITRPPQSYMFVEEEEE